MEGVICYLDIFEQNAEVLTVNKLELYEIRCAVELENYEYIRSCPCYIVEDNDKLYMTRYENIVKNETDLLTVADCYQIKDEYQEAFKNAIEQLNA